jgi:AcrR family transcriptional regulator
MSSRTVNWETPARAAGVEGLRERKKRLLRQQLSDTATEMFMERGFDDVRVTEIAAACGVSEKTVYNYFPTKEALILDRWDSTGAALSGGLADTDVSPVEAAVRILGGELDGMTKWLAAQDDPVRAGEQVRRFGELIGATPSLRAHQHDMTARLIAVAAEVLAGRAGMSAEDPEPRIAATALIGLWEVQFRGLRKYLNGSHTPAQVHALVTEDVRRAARIIDDGLRTFEGAGRA